MKIYDRMVKNDKIGSLSHLVFPFLSFWGALMATFPMAGCNSDKQESKVAVCNESVQFETIGSDYSRLASYAGPMSLLCVPWSGRIR